MKADCSAGPTGGQYLCWLTFTSNADPAQPLYFDVAVVERNGEAWDLKSGLCKR